MGYSDFGEISAEYGFALITFQQFLIHSEQPCEKKKGIQMTFILKVENSFFDFTYIFVHFS